MRELSVFIDESGDFGPLEAHSPFYVVAVVLHDQSDEITSNLDWIHGALTAHGFPPSHGIHTAPLIRREGDYKWLDMGLRRSMFRVLVDFVRKANLSHHSWVFKKDSFADTNSLIAAIAREMGTFIRDNHEYFQSWDRIVIYYDNGQKELTNVVNSVFNSHLETVEVRPRVSPSEYSLLQAADLCCTLTLLRTKIETVGLGLSASESDFFSTKRDSAERALKQGYFKTLDRKRFNS